MQQLAKTSLLFAIIIVVVVVITEGKGREGARHENTSVIKMTLSCFLTKHTAAAPPTLSARTQQTSQNAASLSPSRNSRKL